MKRILHILNTGSFSGAENVAITIINATKDKCESVYVSPRGNIEEILKENSISYIPLKKMSVSEVKSAIYKFKPDIIHAHDFTTSVIVALTFRNIPMISHLHNNPPWIKKINAKTIVYYLGTLRIKKVLTVSDAVLNEYIFGKALLHKSIVVSNPVDINKVVEKAKDGSCTKYDIIFLGRLSLQKNPIRFINIINEIRNKLPNVKACMVGDGELRLECEKRVQELKIADSIQFLGFKENPYGILSKSKIMCVTSDWEGFGLVAVEALALGVPVLATPVGGLIDIVNDDCGSLCGDDSAFIDEIIKLLTEERYLSEKSQGALTRAEKFNNINQYAAKLNDIYFDCINN